MNNKIINKFFLLFLGLFSGFLPLTAADPALDGLLQEVHNEIAQTLAQSSATLPQGLRDGHKALEEYDQAIQDEIKWQNELLWHTDIHIQCNSRNIDLPHNMGRLIIPAADLHVPVGIYRRDLVDGGNMLINLASSFYFYKKLEEARLNHVYKTILNNSDKLLGWLQKLDDTQLADQKAFEKKGWIKVLFSSIGKSPTYTKAEYEFREYIKNSQQLIGYNSFKKELLFPIGLNLGVSQLGPLIKEKIFPLHHKWVKDETYQRFVKAENGTLVPFGNNSSNPQHPLTLLPLTQAVGTFLLSPTLLLALLQVINGLGAGVLQAYIPPYQGRPLLQQLIQFQFPQIPDLFFGKVAGAVYEAVSLAYVLKLMDMIYDRRWTSYISIPKHRQEFKNLLIACDSSKKIALEKNHDANALETLHDVEQALYAFVTKGHASLALTPNDSLGKWLTLKQQGLKPLVACGLVIYLLPIYLKLVESISKVF
jgi:hypothetical protein